MGVLQFGWLAVNSFFAAKALVAGFGMEALRIPICILWTVGAAFVGLKGIKYVAGVATYLPIIPLVVLVVGVAMLGGSAGEYKPPGGVAASGGAMNAVLLMVAAIVGFFATAGAAGVDICASNRDKRDVSLGGIVGIVIAIIFTAGISVISIAGAQASHLVGPETQAMTVALGKKLSSSVFAAVMIGLTLAAFPGACFSSFIAANSFKTTMPKVNPFVSVGIGAIVSIILAATGVAGDLTSVFGLIGASFGPIVGAMAVDYLLAGGKWAGPRAGFNPAGWIAWLVGFIVGILPNPLVGKLGIHVDVPCAPVAAFIVGAVIYFVLAKMGMQTQVIPLPAKDAAPAPQPAAR
jgi:cytosine permease